jgi:hypothetical protein
VIAEEVLLARMAAILCRTRARALEQPARTKGTCEHCTRQSAMVLGEGYELVKVTRIGRRKRYHTLGEER